MKKATLILLLMIFMIPTVQVHAARQISMPHEETFDSGQSSISDLAWWGDCGGSGEYVTNECWSGGCAKIIPPSEYCAGGGYNGGTAALGAFHFNGTSRINIRYLIKVGPTYHDTFYGPGRQNKHLIIHTTSGRFMAMLEPADSGFWTFGVMDRWHQTWFNNGSTDAKSTDGYKTTAYGGKWVSVEHAIDASRGIHTMYIYSQDGQLSGEYATTNDAVGGNIVEIQKIGGYYNGAHHHDPGTYIMIDELKITNDGQLIGPPPGFLSNEPPDNLPPATPHLEIDKQ